LIESRSNPKKWENPEISTGGRRARVGEGVVYRIYNIPRMDMLILKNHVIL
jgi:hypothetical protein